MAETSTMTEAPPETAVVTKKKAVVEKTGNLIMDIAAEVEGLSKTKALNMAEQLAETVEVSYFKLGGVLKLINDNSWFEGSDDFDSFVLEKYGFAGRKARYLITIYDNLVTKQIPWEKVSHLGWTKLKDLAPVLTPDNVDSLVAKATNITVRELKKLLEAEAGEGTKTAKTTADVVKIAFNLKTDQAEVVQQALAKAKGELHTEYDTVALENIMAGYLGGNTALSTPNLDEVIKQTGLEPMLTRIAELFPDYDISVAPAQPATEGAAAQ